MRTSQKYGVAGTIVFLILLFLLLWFVTIRALEAPEMEEVEIEFAEQIEDAGGFSQPAPSPVNEPTPVTDPVPPANTPPADPVLTQEAEQALAMQKQREEEERLRREEELRLEAERKAAAEKAAAERAAAEKAAAEKANALMGGAFKGLGQGGTGGKTTGGSGGGDNPIKNGMSGGNGWSAKGRTLQGSIPKPTVTEFPEGKVVVSFRIDQAGRVTNPKIANGTTISDTNVRNACLAAVRKAQFTTGVDEVEGTITYNFRVN